MKLTVYLILVGRIFFAFTGTFTLSADSCYSRTQADSNTPRPQITLTPSHVRSFPEALAEISRQGKVCIVAESAPIPVTLSEAVITRITQRPLPLKEAVGLLADAYDYTPVFNARRVGKTIVLKKRYKYFRDLPEVTPEEMRRAVENIEKGAFSLMPEPSAPSKTDLVNSVFASLTPEQVEQLEKGGIPISALGRVQRQKLWHYAVEIFCSDILWFLPNGLPSEPGSKYEFALLEREKNGVRVLGRVAIKPPVPHEFRPMPSYAVEDSEKERSDYVAEFDWQKTLADAVTLKQVVDNLNRRTSKGTKFFTYTIEEYLSGKHLTIAGTEDSTPEEVLQAVAHAYGLRVVERSGTLHITVPPRYQAKSVTGIPNLILRSLPEPVVRASLIEAYASAYKEYMALTLKSSRTDAETQRMDQQQRFYFEQDIRRYIVSKEINRRTADAFYTRRAEVEKSGQSVAEFQIPFEDFDPDVKNAESVSIAFMLLNSVANLQREFTPRYITHFDEAILTGGRYTENDQRKLRLQFINKGPNNETHRVGYFDIKYKPQEP